MIKFENKSNGRFYYIAIERDLFDELGILVIRGGNRTSVRRFIYLGEQTLCQTEIERISKIRLARGYTLINP
jgi:hypothetical protein